MTTPDEMRAMAERLEMNPRGVTHNERAALQLAIKGNQEAAAMLRSIAEEREADAKVQNEMRDSILRLKSTMVKNGWIEA